MKGEHGNSGRRGLTNLAGEKALLTAVIGAAQEDFLSKNRAYRASAVLYFAGPEYLAAVQELGLHPSLLPIGVDFNLGDLLQAVGYLVDKAGVTAVASEPTLQPLLSFYEVTNE